jgi:DNA ligase D-like protein (predicted ligase)
MAKMHSFAVTTPNVKRIIRASAKDVIADLAPPPQWIEPELCKLVTKIPAGDGWAHEIKFDGFRMHARIVNGAAALLTRNGLDWTAKYPDIATAIGALNCRQAYLDGELCAVLPDGTTSFAALQGHGDAPAALVYFAFDLLHLDGEDLARLPLLERKARLEALLGGASPTISYSGHVVGNGALVFEEGSKLGVEGMVSKLVDRPYMPGNRGVWVKTKFLNRQEFVVVGWTDPEGSRSALGSLLLGYYRDDGKLIYAGRAGTGMTESDLRGLLEKLRPLASDRMTVDVPPPKTTRFGKPLVLTRVHWVRPELVAEVTYLTWTADGLLRHVVYEGLREDKSPRDVRRNA